MPSIIEVDTIKNKTGTQNTVLSTDGSGNNTLNAGVIKSNTGSNTGLTIASDGQVTISQNNPTITLGSSATFPSGHIINTYTANYVSSSTITIAHAAGGTASNPDNLVSDGTNTIFNVDARTFVKVVSKTVNIASGNGVIVHAWCGGQQNIQSSLGAYGFVFKVPDASGNNRGYQGSTYPHYQAANMPAYLRDWSATLYTGPNTGNSNDTIGTGNIEIAVYGFCYNETSGSNTQTMRVSSARMVIHEVKI